MGTVNFTPSQRAAIENRGGALLVAAAAGSGKTKVLVERLLSRITDDKNPVNIDQFLIITYTKSAAAELRSKILDEINERIAKSPENRHLRRQVPLVYKAQISTIHSFCSSILRENAQHTDISPDFRVMESDEGDIIMQKVLDEVLNDRYESMDGDFALLTDTMAAGRDDAGLQSLVIEFYTKLKSHSQPEKWADERLQELEASSKANDLSETAWGRLILEQAIDTLEYWLSAFGKAERALAMDDALSAAYSESFKDTLYSLEVFYEALKQGWNKACAKLPISFPKLKPLRGGCPEAEEAKRIRDACKKAMGKLAETFDSESKDLIYDIEAITPAIRGLFSLTLDFDKAYTIEKRRKKVLDFSDLEHLSLKLLLDENNKPSEKARELSERFIEIMVDEYQDANEIQDTIISSVSKNGANVFMVGDVKQSIYRFRLADPTIFLKKYEAFAEAKEAKDGEPRKIILQDNFRSRKNVLDAVNFVFSTLMSKDFGEMDYTENERLNLGKKDFPESSETAFEFDIIEVTDNDEDEELDKTETEAAFVAGRIRELVDSGMLVSEKDVQRRIAYRDIAILLRSIKGKAEIYADALKHRNIPFYNENSGGFWSRTEICVMVSLLSVVDNPRQDVPLISALRSPLFGFTPDELAEIRAADKEADFFSALKKASSGSKKYAEFIDFLSELRLRASDMSADDFIWHLYAKTSATAIFGAMDGGVERKSNLMVLLDMARQFENSGYRGLFDFVAHLNKLMKRGGEVAAKNSDSAGNAVTITSIHKAKGLEYPVVIIADTGKQFNRDDTKRPLLVHTELGVGPKRLDLKRKIEYTTLPRMAIAKKMTDEMLAEELRVLYVAMTRAKEKLIITCSSKNSQRLLDKLSKLAVAPIAPQIFSGCVSMGEWLILTALLRKEGAALKCQIASNYEESRDSLWDIRLIEAQGEKEEISELPEIREAELKNEEVPVNELEEIEKNLSFVYSHEAALRLPSKLTATGIKGRFLDNEAAEEAEKIEKPLNKYVFERPNFALEATELTAAERGVALHLAMQYIDYRRCRGIDGIESEIKRLADMKIISKKQAAAVHPEKILSFFESELGKSVQNAENILREFKFSILVPAAEYFPDGGEEEILLQGVVDLCVEDKSELTIIDFKTDYVDSNSLIQKTESYRPQIEAYARAMERITGKPAAKKFLYFFHADKAAEIRDKD